MQMRKGGVIIDVPENGAQFYERAGYEKVEAKVKAPKEEVTPVPEPEAPPVVVPEAPKPEKPLTARQKAALKKAGKAVH